MKAITRRHLTIGIGLILILHLPVVLALMSLFCKRPDNLGVSDGRLAPCPDKPNCVSTQSDDPRHAIEPIEFSGSADAAMERLRHVLREQPRTQIISEQGRYVHAESRSRIFRFVDDLEFFVDDSESVIHFRSASRVGHSDLGVNRTRAESIRTAFERLPQIQVE